MAGKKPSYRLDDVQRKMVRDNLNLARREAWRYAKRTQIEFKVLESAAFEGLCQAAYKYDKSRLNRNTGKPLKFSSLAVPYIRGSILHYIRDKTYALRFTHKMREIWSRGKKFIFEDGSEDKRLTDDQIAEKLGVKVEEWREAVFGCSGPPMSLMDDRVAEASYSIEVSECRDALYDYADHARKIASGMSEQQRNLFRAFLDSRSPTPSAHMKSALRGMLDCLHVDEHAGSDSLREDA